MIISSQFYSLHLAPIGLCHACLKVSVEGEEVTTMSTRQHKEQAPFLPSSEQNILTGCVDVWEEKSHLHAGTPCLVRFCKYNFMLWLAFEIFRSVSIMRFRLEHC